MTPSSFEGSDVPAPKSPGMPGDFGLPGLGLMMQLWAGMDALVQISAVFFVLRISVGQTGGMLGLLALGIIRALVHYIAGTEIRAGGMKIPSRVRALLIVSVLQLGVLLWMAGEVGARSLLLGADILLWPGLLVVMFHLPQWRDRFARLREGELELSDPNRGIEAAGAIMIALGCTGVVLTGAVAWAMVDGTWGRGMFAELGSWVLLSAIALLLRGVLHVGIGVRAVRGADPALFHRLVRAYVRVCWVTTAIAVLPLLYGILENVDFMGTATFSMVTMLSMWPLVLRGYANQVGGEYGELEDRRFARATDGGLVTVGWLLCAVAMGSAIQAVYALLYGPVSYAGVGMLHGPGWFVDASLPGWTGALGLALTLWAGLELVYCTARARVAALVFSLCTIAVTLYTRADGLGDLSEGIERAFVRVEQLFVRVDLLLALLVPVIVAVLALRWRRPTDR